MEIFAWYEWILLASFVGLGLVNFVLAITEKKIIYVAIMILWFLFAHSFINSIKLDYLIEQTAPPAVEEIVE